MTLYESESPSSQLTKEGPCLPGVAEKGTADTHLRNKSASAPLFLSVSPARLRAPGYGEEEGSAVVHFSPVGLLCCDQAPLFLRSS